MSKFTEEEVEQMEELVKELLRINEELNSMVIGFNAKLANEEAKVKRLTAILNQSGIQVQPIYKGEDGLEIMKSTIPL